MVSGNKLILVLLPAVTEKTQQKAPSSSWGPPTTLSVRGSVGLQCGLDSVQGSDQGLMPPS